MVELSCKCGQKYKVADKNVGKKFACKKCDEIITVRTMSKATMAVIFVSLAIVFFLCALFAVFNPKPSGVDEYTNEEDIEAIIWYLKENGESAGTIAHMEVVLNCLADGDDQAAFVILSDTPSLRKYRSIVLDFRDRCRARGEKRDEDEEDE